MFIRYLFALIGLIAAIAFLAVFTSNADQRPVEESSCFYLRSLHYTANGMAHWYSKENGGLEQLTGIPYSELGCKTATRRAAIAATRPKRLKATLKLSAIRPVPPANRTCALTATGGRRP